MITSQRADSPSAQPTPDISALYYSYGDELIKTAARELARFSATDLAFDAVNDVFLKLEQNGLDPEVRDWQAYLHRLVMNRAIDMGRSEARRDKRLEVAATDAMQNQDSDLHNPARTFESTSRSNSLARAIETLPASERDVIIGLFRNGLKNREVAAALELSQGRISQLRNQALQRIRQSLASEGWAEL